VKTQGLTLSLHSIRVYLRTAGETGTPGVAVECADIRKNTNGEGRSLGRF
jgi:hypothetical protein